jgi:hypothetical protein
MRLRVVAVLVALALAACGGSTSGSGGSVTGVRGTVTLGPTCPVESQQSPCADVPLATVVSFFDGSGALVASVRSGGDGTFRVTIAPGTYSVKASPQIGLAPAGTQPSSVSVPKHGYVAVTLRVDSGIR